MQGKLIKSHRDLTAGVVYDLLEPRKCNHYYVIDDNNSVIWVSKDSFELVGSNKVGEKVYVRDNDNDEWIERTLIHDLGDQFFGRYICVHPFFEDEHTNGQKTTFKGYVQMRETNPDVEKEIERLEKELAILKSKLYV